MEIKYSSSPKGKIFYETAGSGDRLIVFLHGFLGAPYKTDELEKTFRDRGYMVASPFLPGHGQSFTIPSGYVFENFVSDVAEWLKEISVGKKVVLIGHSLGGATAWELANRLTDIDKVIMISPGLGRLDQISLITRARNFLKESRIDFPGNFLGTSFKLVFKYAEIRLRQVWYARRLTKFIYSVKVLSGFPKSVFGIVLWGDSDLTTPFALYKDFFTNGPEVKFFPGAHHWFIGQSENLFWDELKSLL